ncbi:uroporphyrinogen-III C-methyltransferase [Robertmurraya kyonggiensis]|uniref:Uroporphyrinogen-III C-methyltransferase n=1 Tax=Robertmurraya kyonggiensis TaxID=1037680 RepID=A0A4U1D1I0_9BACI|nr:uroporphyrinogen-III C-methyltransferase [Robertmurraya kyonggiensis]TKC16159.1 uroporphyrinogen-III C-methyltransferase [Robertmurraya kyonggiensis]
MKGSGKVFFVGAGPGDPKLITVRGMELLKAAEVVLYDRLVNAKLLDYVSKDALIIDCGKEKDNHHIPQENMNQLLLRFARNGKQVVRLKGGDPSIFGRVGEEAQVCAEHEIPFEIVPGVTSGIGASIYAGIPLTHRDYASSVTFVTGHRRGDKNTQELNWEHLANGVDTVVFYMGMHNLPFIQKQLIFHGRDARTPVALIRHGTLDRQEVLTGELWNIAQEAAKASFKAPAIIVIGEVVQLRDKLKWWDKEGSKKVEFLLHN